MNEWTHKRVKGFQQMLEKMNNSIGEIQGDIAEKEMYELSFEGHKGKSILVNENTKGQNQGRDKSGL